MHAGRFYLQILGQIRHRFAKLDDITIAVFPLVKKLKGFRDFIKIIGHCRFSRLTWIKDRVRLHLCTRPRPVQCHLPDHRLAAFLSGDKVLPNREESKAWGSVCSYRRQRRCPKPQVKGTGHQMKMPTFKTTTVLLVSAFALSGSLSGCGTGAMNILTSPSGWFAPKDDLRNDPTLIEME